LRAVRPLWKPVKAVVNEGVWNEALPKIKDEIQVVYLSHVRLETIRGLVAAYDDIDVSETSDDPSDYASSTFGDDFFSLATSLFTNHRYYRRKGKLLVCQFPNTSAVEFSTSHSFQKNTGFRQVYLISSILEAAGLEPDFATLGDLESLEGEWLWTNHPKKSKRRDTYDWVSLVSFFHSLVSTSSARLSTDTLLVTP
jgi:hypothetical protein